VTLLLTNHTTPGHSIETEQLDIRLDNAPKPTGARIQRIDEDHANPKRLWQEMGEPECLSDKDLESLEEASQLVTEKQSLRYQDGAVFLKVDLPPHAVAAVTIQFKESLFGVRRPDAALSRSSATDNKAASGRRTPRRRPLPR